MGTPSPHEQRVDFVPQPYQWTHWRLSLDGAVARLLMQVQEDAPLRPGYELKLNSYDLSVDIELYDVLMRLRFEHPEVRAVVLGSGYDRVFCSGANIYMLGSSSHGFKVNFCKFTNETRCAIEESSAEAGQTWIAALKGACAGGGYELAMACDEIYLVDDGNSAVSLPEVPLLGVLPGTGGLTRLVDKRRVRPDLADVFCTKAEGFKARDAVKGGFVDGAFSRSQWDAQVAARAAAAVERHPAPARVGIVLNPLPVQLGPRVWDWGVVRLEISDGSLYEAGRVATLTVEGPEEGPPVGVQALFAMGDRAWPLRFARALEAALFELRFNHPLVGVVLIQARGEAAPLLAWDRALEGWAQDQTQGRGDEAHGWLVHETRVLLRRSLRRLDNTSRSFYALLDQGHNFNGILLELALAADRAYALDVEGNGITVDVANGWVSEAGVALPNFYTMANGRSRMENRFTREPHRVVEVLGQKGSISAAEAEGLGLVTFSFDDIDWEDEIRIAVEERISLSPDALTGMEQNLRFVGAETMECRVYGRLSAWQNWIFQRPNAVGETGALSLYGQPDRPVFDFRRT